MATGKQKEGAEKAAKKQTREGTGIHAPVQPSADLGAIVGADPLPRSEVISKVWEYIRNNNLQAPEDKRTINADDNLKKVFGKDSATMFEMNKFISAHLSKVG